MGKIITDHLFKVGTDLPGWRIKKNTLWALLAVLLYRIALDLSYYFVITPIWGYSGLILSLNVIKLAESYFLLIIVFVLMPKSSQKLSNVMMWMLILVGYIPLLTFFAFANESRIYMYAVTVFCIAVFLLLRLPMPDLYLPGIKQSAYISYPLFIGLMAVVFVLLYIYLGLSFKFDFSGVYEIRADYVAAQIPFSGYLFNWVANVVNPVFLALFVYKRKWLPVILILILQVLLYSATGLKGFLLAPPFVLALMWIIQRKKALFFMAMGLACIVLAGTVSFRLVNDLSVTSLFARRTLVLPAQLSFYYYDFFSKNEPVFLSHSIFRFFLDYPYRLPMPNLIADVYYGQPEMSANNGIFADAYMNFGFAGLALWALLLFIILKIVDTSSRGVVLCVAIAAIAMPVLTLVNCGPLTTLLTHGLLLAFLLLYLLPREISTA